MENRFDVIVVGGGPGGSSAAMYLARQGRKVLLVDKARFPRDKTCGDAVGGKALRVLRELNLLEGMQAVPHERIEGVIFSSPKGTILHIPFKVNGEGREAGYVAMRQHFDNYLFQHAKKTPNVTVLEEFQATDLVWENKFVAGIKGIDLGSKQAKEFKAKLVIGADGSTSIVATKVGVNTIVPEHNCIALRVYYRNVKGNTNNIEIHFVKDLLPGYFWIFPLQDGYANVGVGMVTSDVKKKKVNLQEAMFKCIKENELFKERFEGAEILSDVKGWTLPFGSFHRKSYGNGYILLGDAASLVDPFSGEGIGNAMTSARIAAPIIEKAFKANDFSENVFREYDKNLWEAIGPELDTSYKLQRIGRITPLLNFVVDKAANNKDIQNVISGMLANEDAKKDFLTPLFYLKLLFA